jgi:hypothetical protein
MTGTDEIFGKEKSRIAIIIETKWTRTRTHRETLAKPH